MKKIITLIAIFTISFTGAFSQTTEGQSLDDLLTQLGNDDTLRNYDTSVLAGTIDDTQKDEIRADLEAEGYDTTTVDTIMQTVDDIDNGTAGTLGQILDDPAIEDALVDIVARQAVNELFTGEQAAEMEKTLNTINGMLGLLKGFGQATANAAVANNLMGYYGYDLFAISIGPTIGTSPDLFSIMDIMDAQGKVAEDQFIDEAVKIAKNGAGVSIHSFSLGFGVNTSFLLDGLYLGAVIGSSNVELTTDATTAKVLGIPVYTGAGLEDGSETTTNEPSIDFEANMDAAVYGIRAQYQLMDPFAIPILYRWNGLTVGSGIIYNHFNIDAKTDLSETIGVTPGTLGAEFAINSMAVTIPLEISTGIRVVSALNLSLGLGIDLQFGKTEVEFDLLRKGEDSLSDKIMTSILDEILSRGEMNFPYSEEYNPQFINPRIQVGAGLGIGPLTLLDVNATFYPMTGFALGANIIFRW